MAVKCHVPCMDKFSKIMCDQCNLRLIREVEQISRMVMLLKSTMHISSIGSGASDLSPRDSPKVVQLEGESNYIQKMSWFDW